jgi:hypothetical protein
VNDLIAKVIGPPEVTTEMGLEILSHTSPEFYEAGREQIADLERQAKWQERVFVMAVLANRFDWDDARVRKLYRAIVKAHLKERMAR